MKLQVCSCSFSIKNFLWNCNKIFSTKHKEICEQPHLFYEFSIPAYFLSFFIGCKKDFYVFTLHFTKMLRTTLPIKHKTGAGIEQNHHRRISPKNNISYSGTIANESTKIPLSSPPVFRRQIILSSPGRSSTSVRKIFASLMEKLPVPSNARHFCTVPFASSS